MKAVRKEWQLLPPADGRESLARALGVEPLTAHLLINRGVADEEAARSFLRPDLSQLADPFSLTGVDVAVERIRSAIRTSETIGVWGDFDVDGITSTVLLSTALSQLGAKVEHHVPDRMREGYGLNRGGISKLASRCSLMITVDCGIAAQPEIDFAGERGLDVIVTDHHEPSGELPRALAVIDPKRPDCGHSFKELAGVGVAFKLVQALFSELGGDPTQFLDLVTLGTVADVVPLLGENRALVACGLPRLRASERVGVKALLEVTGLHEKPELGSGQVGFVLAPRINAAGRLADAKEAVELLLTDDPARALAIARAIDERNRERQRVEERILAEALAMVEDTFDPDRDKSIVLVSKDWHEGVKGIVASRIAEKFCRPTFLFSVRDGVARGSARGIQGFNLHQVLCTMSELFTKWGGHAAAAGMTLPVSRIDEFRQLLARRLDEVLAPEDLIPKLRVDAAVESASITHGFADELKRLAPFGMGNPSPVLAVKGVVLEGQQRVGAGGDHLKFLVRDEDRAHEAIAFRLADIDVVEQHFGPTDVAFHLEQDEWQGRARLQLRVVDVQLGERPRSSAGDAVNLGDGVNAAGPQADRVEAAAGGGEEAGDPLVERLFAEAERIISDEEYKNIGDADCFYTKVVGVTFEGRQDVLGDLAAADEILLRREPDNEHDKNAIRVDDAAGRQIGYLAAPLAKQLAPLVDDGALYDGRITEVTGGDEKHLGVNLLIRKVLGEGDDEAVDRAQARAEWSALSPDELLDRIADELLGGGSLTDKQREGLTALEAGDNTLVVMGTGRGKSLIFHAHAARLALAERKLSIFVYPLRALIADQQQHLDEVFAPIGLRAVTLNGDVAPAAREDAFAEAAAGDIDAILTTPEFLHHHLGRFGALADRVGFFVVDEAHHVCTASSGHRPLYRRLDETVAAVGSPLVLAVTATAGDDVAAEVCRSLAIDTRVIDRSVRDNLRIVNRRAKKGKEEYVSAIAARGEKTIVYVNSREQSVRLAQRLRRELGDRTGAVVYYNAGLNKEMRKAVETRFRSGRTRIVIATSAFGEGINIPDVRNVVLYHMPLSAIEYNQQSGRAGRDGDPALIHVLFGEEDAGLNRRLLESYSPSRAALVELYKLLRDLASQEGGVGGTRAAGDAGDDEATGNRSGLVATNDDLLEMLRDRTAKVSISARGVSSGLRILEELGLLRLEGSSRYRRIILEPAPARKLSLSESVRFQEGADEKDAFAEFSAWALESRDDELLSAINRPICPTDAAASGAAAASSASDASAVLAAAFGDVVMQDPGGT